MSIWLQVAVQMLTSHTPPWNCPATSLTQSRVYSIGLATGLCVRNCWGRKQGSPAAQRWGPEAYNL